MVAAAAVAVVSSFVRTEIAINAPATPIFTRRIIKMTDGKSLSSGVLLVVVAAFVPPETALVSRFIDPIGAGADVVVGAGASLLACNQDGVSVMVVRIIINI